MSSDEKYALNWGSHADHLKKAFDKILEAKDFVDVTLSCEGKKIKAHRVILSACSKYFYDILKDNPCSHPIIVLRGTKYNNIFYLLKFMYCGEVKVPIDQFSSFLQTAELLEVYGLSNSNNTTKSDDEENHRDLIVPQDPKRLSPSLKLSSAANKRKTVNLDNDDCNYKKKKDIDFSGDGNLGELDHKELENEITNGSTKPASAENIPNMQQLLADSSYLSKEANPECECPVCGEKFLSHYFLKSHISYHMGSTKCQICGKVLSRLDILKRHLISVHKIQGATPQKER